MCAGGHACTSAPTPARTNIRMHKSPQELRHAGDRRLPNVVCRPVQRHEEGPLAAVSSQFQPPVHGATLRHEGARHGPRSEEKLDANQSRCATHAVQHSEAPFDTAEQRSVGIGAVAAEDRLLLAKEGRRAPVDGPDAWEAVKVPADVPHGNHARRLLGSAVGPMPGGRSAVLTIWSRRRLPAAQAPQALAREGCATPRLPAAATDLAPDLVVLGRASPVSRGRGSATKVGRGQEAKDAERQLLPVRQGSHRNHGSAEG
mmetsp:Transcript_23545/g.74606  ORF Transcript_23545/g.74606 Transcript_23545/m.74606 type:complete len:259 (+) Transcript_23545:2-778(+)